MLGFDRDWVFPMLQAIFAGIAACTGGRDIVDGYRASAPRNPLEKGVNQ